MRVLVALAVVVVVSAVPRERRQVAETTETYCNNGRDVCVPYYLCRDGSIITDGAGLIDIRIGPARDDNSTDTRTGELISECPSFLDVCCNDPSRVIPTPAPYQPRCGRRNEDGVNARITGFPANQAQFGEFPWMTAVLKTEYVEGQEANLYVCGGSLVHDQVVLTGAHCVFSLDHSILNVRLGEWDTQKAYELYGHQDRKVNHVIIHEGFNPNNLQNDFALLFLESPVELAPNVDTICLPHQGSSFDGSYCWATGWGKDQFGKEGVFQNILKEIALPVVGRGDCQNYLRQTRLGSFFKLDHSFTCAGGEPGQDTCTGDGGSPLVCQVNQDTYVQAGIVAWGIGCGEQGIPGVYADLGYAANWITTNIDQALFDRYSIDNTNYWSYQQQY